MKLKTALVVAFLLVGSPAVVPVTAQTATAAAKTPPKLPSGAARHLSRYRSRTERARHAYKAAIDAEQARLERALRRDLQVATQRNDFAGAHAILAAIEHLHAGPVPKSAASAGVADAKAQIEQELLGKWNVRCGPNFQTVWTFRPDGTVLSAKGAPQGRWQWEQENRRILLRWSETEWDSLNLPLNAKGTVGDTYHRQGWTVEAVKLL